MFNGCLRKAVFPLVGMVALGWVLIIIGFSMEVINEELPAYGSSRYPWWMVIVVTPIMLIMAVVQAAVDKNKPIVVKIVGATITFLSALFLTAVGYLMTQYGIILHHSVETDGAKGLAVDSFSLQFCGAALSAIFWVALTCVSHFYKREVTVTA